MKCLNSQGTLFLPLPDGLGLMYNLLGTSDPPEAEEQLNRNIPSRVYYTESLRVKNWLNKLQRLEDNIYYALFDILLYY